MVVNKTSTCDICCDVYNKSTRKSVQCPFCSKNCCLQCAKMYISATAKDPHCMHCKVGWNSNFVRTVFPSTWLNKDYRNLREIILFDMEVAKMSDTQQFCEAYKHKGECILKKESYLEVQKDLKAKSKQITKLYDQCKQNLWFINDENENENEIERLKKESHGLHLQLKNAESELQQVTESIQDLTETISKLNHDIAANTENENQIATEVNNFHIACPKEYCRGFISQNNNKCGLCNIIICKDCHEMISTMEIVHECVPETKASVEILKTDSKPCPKCASYIHKISGCDQMWCTRCKTAFSWNSGIIDDHIVHNPHYFEWMRTRQDEDDDNNPLERCNNNNDEPFVLENNTFVLVQKIRNKVSNDNQRQLIMNMVRLLIHIDQVEIPHMIPVHIRNIPHDPNRDLRIQFMLNELTENEFKSSLQKREKDRLKREETAQIFETFKQVGNDLLWQFIQMDTISLDDFLKYMEDVRVYTNKSLHKLAELYGIKLKLISSDFSEMQTHDKVKKNETDQQKSSEIST